MRDNAKIFQLTCISLILLIGFLLRYYGMWFSYPLLTHIDEYRLVNKSLEMLATEDLNPYLFIWPSLLYYTELLLIILTNWSYDLFLGIPPKDIPLSSYFIVGRGFTILASTTSILLAWNIAKKLVSPSLALIAAALIAFSPLHVQNSFIITPDIWVAILGTVILHYSLKIYDRGDFKDFLLAGFFLGLAAGFKYTAAALFVYILTAHILRIHFRNLSFNGKGLLFSASTSLLTFFLTTPYSLLDINRFIPYFQRNIIKYRSGHPGFEALGDHSYFLYGKVITSSEGLGILAIILAITGIFLCFKNKNWKFLLITAFPIVFYALVGNYKTFFSRNIVAVIPPLSLLAAFGFQNLIKSINLKKKEFSYTLFLLISVFMLTPLFLQSFAEVKRLNLTDTRWTSLQWIKGNLPKGSKIAREAYTPPVEEFSDEYEVVYLGLLGLHRNKLKIDSSTDYIILSSGNYARLFRLNNRYLKEKTLYSEYFEKNKPIYELTPDGINTQGPVIRIYKKSKDTK